MAAFIGGILSPPPVAPDGIQILEITDSSIKIGWTDNSDDETGFEVWSSTDGVSYSLVDTTAADATDYTNTGLDANTNYWYRVRAVRSGDATASDYATAGPFSTNVAGPLYVRFKVKFDSAELGGQGAGICYLIDPNSGGSVLLLYNVSGGHWTYSANGSADTHTQALVANTYVTVDLELDYSVAGSLTVTPKFDGTSATPVTADFIGCPRELLLGAVDNTGTGSNRTFDDVAFGNSGFGSTDFLSADFASTIVPPFDGVVDQQGSKVVIASTAMHVFPDAGFQGYADFAIPLA